MIMVSAARVAAIIGGYDDFDAPFYGCIHGRIAADHGSIPAKRY